MAFVVKFFADFHEAFERNADVRTTHWALMSSPLPTLAICLSYVYLVKVLGPRIMRDRKPFELRNALIAYNAFQVVFSAWLFYECLMGGWKGDYSFRCQPVDYSNSDTATRISISGWLTGHYSYRCEPVNHSTDPITMRMVHACWWYYFSKFTEFMDTIFFVLRKKNDHISTLHVIHHGVMPMSVWFGVKFTPGGHSTFFGFLNTFVHIIMYSYYLLSALGPQMQKYLWWKKYLTSLQMVQFIAIIVHAFQLLFTECNYPRAFVWWIGMHAVMFYFLFSDFYKQSYSKQQAIKARAKAKADALAASEETNHNEVMLSNGQANGHANGYANGYHKSATDYYITATTDLHQRAAIKISNGTH